MKRKGFTLIELLATIVVIAIIALIAMPIVLGVIDKAKKAAFEDSVKIANRQIEMYLFKNGLSEIPDDGIEVKDLDIKSNFTGGKFKNLNGTIIAEQIKNSEYCASGPIDNLVFSDPNDCISADELITDKPTFTYTVTSKSITAIVNETENSATFQYAFSKDNGANWTDMQVSNSFTFSDLETGTYNVKVRACDQINNCLDSESVSISTKKIDAPTYSISPDSGWAAKKTVTIDYPSGYTNEYSLDGGETWKPYSSPIEFTKSDTIIARVHDGKNYVTASSQTVAQVDSDKPTVSTFTYTRTSKSIKVTATGEDKTSDITYAFSNDNGATWTNKQTSNEYTFDDLETGTYNIKVRVYDQAENYLDSAAQSIQTLGIDVPTYSINPSSGWATKKTVTINYPNGYTNEYSLDGGETWKPYTNPVEFTTSGTIIARVNDGKNYVTGSSQSVAQVDSDKPTSSTFTYTVTSKSIYVTASGTDATSSIQYAFSKDNGNTWTNKQTSNEYTFDDLETGTYNIKVRVYDQAENYLDSAAQSIQTLGIDVPTYSINPSSGWATKKTVTINYPNGYTNEYSLDGGETWKPYSSPIEFTKTGTIIARVHDGKNYVTASSQTVAQVDSDKPTSSTFTYTRTSKSITVVATGEDKTSSIQYAFSKDNGATWTNKQTSNEYTFDDLETGTYNIKVRVYDQANNYLDSTVQEIKLIGIGEVTQSLLDNNTTYGNYTYMNGTYLKGVQENNYVWYNGFLWRIMGINENGTVRLITEENVTAISYGASGQGLLYATNEGYINDWLNDYFLDNLDSSKTDIITKSDWCLNTTTDSTSARQTCEGGTTFSADVGLITLDEYNLSGASSTNLTYYLVNRQYYWTLTPYSTSNTWNVASNGNANNIVVTRSYGVRPVINVRANAVITGGNGSLSDAYILNQTSESKTGKLNEKASSGEYVSLDGKTYRVVSKETNGTKLIYDGYYEATAGTTYTMAFGSDNTFTTSSGIGQVLNGDVLTWLGNSEKIIETNWYQTSGFGYGTKYTNILEDKTNPISARVGLIRIGEMLSGQSASILTKNYTVRSSFANVKRYWTLTKSTSYAWDVNNNSSANNTGVAGTYGVRPVIVVSTDTTISSGNGTLSSPYIIG